MSYEIQPFAGAGSLKFGMSCVNVREILEESFRSFKRSPLASYPCDYFENIGVFTYYDSFGNLEAIEFAAPAQPILNGVSLLNIGFDALIGLMQAKDTEFELEESGAIAPNLGLSFYAPHLKNSPSENCESILVFKAGYYD